MAIIYGADTPAFPQDVISFSTSKGTECNLRFVPISKANHKNYYDITLKLENFKLANTN